MPEHAPRHAIDTMLDLQDRMNQKVHPQWIEQGFAWYRAVWVECGELMDHYGYKWWKKQQPDWEQVRLEIVDIWHFGMSALFAADKSRQVLGDEVEAGFAAALPAVADVREATEMLALSSLQSRSFSIPAFRALMQAADLSFDELYRHYIGKNVLNFFRQDNGYKSGTYVKTWQGREDNEHLADILQTVDSDRDDFSDAVYQELATRYASVVAG